jgi:hypothetical protein
MTVSPNSSSPDPKTLWKGQDMTPQAMTPEMLETRSRNLDHRIGQRNRWEYAAGLLVGIGTLLTGLFLLLSGPLSPPSAMVGVGMLLLSVGSVVSVLQLHRRTSGGTRMDGASSILESYRAELVRQRDALRSVFVWYILPYLPGIVLIYSSVLLSPDGLNWRTLVPAAITAAFLVWVLHANKRAADCIDDEIDELDREARQ